MHRILKNIFLVFVLIATITSIAYFPMFQNTFTNWDDHVYITENHLIQRLSPDLVYLCFSGFYYGIYHPLTLISYALDFSFLGADPWFFHCTSLLLHIINAFLVYILVQILFKKKSFALVSALVFAVHPVHSEAVVWLSARKDVLYSMFFLLAMISYLRYLENAYSRKAYISALFLFLLALLSKGVAISLPAVLLLFDYLYQRKLFSKKVLLEKIPFVVLSLFFGILAFIAPSSAGSIMSNSDISSFDRFLFVCFGFANYIWKSIVPLRLSAFYPYPMKNESMLAMEYYLYPLVLILFMLLLYYGLRKNRKVAFACLFFLATIFMLLQIIPLGSYLMAERYVYIPSLSLQVLLLFVLFRYLKNRKILSTAIVLFLLIFMFLTHRRVQVWKNSESLWTDVIQKFPHAAVAYNNRGFYYYENNKNEEALQDYNTALSILPAYADVYINRGLLFDKLGMIRESYVEYNRAVVLDPGNAKSWSNRGISRAKMNDYQGAVQDFSKSISIQPMYAEAYSNRGGTYIRLQEYDRGIEDLKQAIRLKPQFPGAVYNLGMAYRAKGENNTSIAYFERAIEMDPHNDAYLFSLGFTYGVMGDRKKAIEIFNKVLEINQNNSPAWYFRGLAYQELGNTVQACHDFTQAQNRGYQPASVAIEQYCQ
jgi:protein O-mannosyl-transferase